MKLADFVERELAECDELRAMLESDSVGASIQRLDTVPFDSHTFRQLASKYADGHKGPFGQSRLALYHQIGDLLERLRAIPGNENLKRYELKDSFIGGEEADLIMLVASHEEMSQEKLAHDVLRCSKNAIGDRRARIRDGIRIGGMGIQAEFGYRGEFQSSAHPVSLPLNLSEVYLLFDALAEYASRRDPRDPHRTTAERIAGMVKSQLSDYAKGKLESRLQEMGFGEIGEVPPVFSPDSPDRRALRDRAAANPAHWTLFEKSGTPATVELADGSTTTGIILPSAQAHHFIEEHGIERKDKRPCCIIYRSKNDFDIMSWADVVDVRGVEGW